MFKKFLRTFLLLWICFPSSHALDTWLIEGSEVQSLYRDLTQEQRTSIAPKLKQDLTDDRAGLLDRTTVFWDNQISAKNDQLGQVLQYGRNVECSATLKGLTETTDPCDRGYSSKYARRRQEVKDKTQILNAELSQIMQQKLATLEEGGAGETVYIWTLKGIEDYVTGDTVDDGSLRRAEMMLNCSWRPWIESHLEKNIRATIARK